MFIIEFRAKIEDEINDQYRSADRSNIFFIEDSKLFYIIDNLLNFQVELRLAFGFWIFLANSIKSS